MENKVTIGSLAAAMAQTTGKSRKACEEFAKEFFKVVADNLREGETLKIKGFGNFKISEVESRTSVNVNTGEPYEIAKYKKVVFTPSKELASAINAPFEEFASVEMDDDIPEEIFDEEIEEESLSDEDNVSVPRLEMGSQEEASDDEISLEAYTIIEKKEEQRETTVALVEDPDTDKEEKEERSFPDDTFMEEAYEKESSSHADPVYKQWIYSETIAEEESVEEELPQNTVEKDGSALKDSIYEKMYSDDPEEDEDADEVLPPQYNYEAESKDRFGMGLMVGSLSTFALCVVIFMLGCFFDWWPVNFGSSKDLMSEEQKEEAMNIPGEGENKVEEEASIQPEQAPVYDTVSTTRYLTTIAREHYGDFNFWPYIYLENESILGHPDRITPGTKVVVPPLSKYGVDPTNKEDVKKAKEKSLEIYSRYKK